MLRNTSWISMSIFTALKRARLKIEEYPGITFKDAANLCMRTSSDGSPHDYRTAGDLHDFLPIEIVDLDSPLEIRRALSYLIENIDYDWAYFFPSGREAVRNALNRNEYQVFRNADLYQDSPSLDVVSWWDLIANKFRSHALDNSYREAELKSLEIERNLLHSMDCPYEPVWVALNDNSLGYDIRSYRFSETEWIPFAIEVKSTSTKWFRFYLSRNEANLAMRMKTNYALHYWTHESSEPLILSSSQVLTNLPLDQGLGKWDSVIVEGFDSQMF